MAAIGGARPPGANEAGSVGLWSGFVLVWVPLLILAATVTGTLYSIQARSTRDLARLSERQAVQLAAQHLRQEMGSVRSDLLYLANQPGVSQALSPAATEARARVTSDYLVLARYKTVYDQIRLLDLQGQERVRVEWRDGNPGVAAEAQLLNKSGRYYFEAASTLDPGDVYVSPFDLNVEHGRIEQPLKPTIRFATGVFDPQGVRQGVAVLNYIGARLLQQIREIESTESGSTWLVNEAGYWLAGPSGAEEWGFMYPDRQDRTMALKYPEAWAQLGTPPGRGQFQRGGALFTYRSVSVGDGQRARHWWIVSFRSPQSIAALTAPLARRHWIGFVILALATAIVAWLLAMSGARRRRAEAETRASEARLSKLLEAAPDGVVVSDGDGIITLVNAQAQALFGYTREELLGQSVDMLVPDAARDRHASHRARYTEHPRARPMGEGLDLQGRRKDGSEFPVAISLSPVHYSDRTLIFSDIRDITEQRRTARQVSDLNRALASQNRELQTVNKELEAFSYSVSHDLRAPLRAIDGFSQALMEDYGEQLDETGVDYLKRVRGGAQRMGHLIDDLLKLSRVARSALQCEWVDLSAMAEQVVRELRARDPERDVHTEIEAGLGVQADPNLMGVLLDNLLGNAWKFTARASSPAIAFCRSEYNGQPVYLVRDNGAGFDMKYANRLFGPFQRLHDSRDFPGTGIGLATVQRIVHRHGGRIWAEGRP